MNEFERHQEEMNFTRKDLLERIREYSFEDLDTMSMVVRWISKEVESAGLTNTPKGRIHFGCKQAALYFDAGYPGESIKMLEQEKEAAKKDGLLDYFNDMSRGLQDSINEM
jgi:hypothetical protein